MSVPFIEGLQEVQQCLQLSRFQQAERLELPAGEDGHGVPFAEKAIGGNIQLLADFYMQRQRWIFAHAFNLGEMLGADADFF